MPYSLYLVFLLLISSCGITPKYENYRTHAYQFQLRDQTLNLKEEPLTLTLTLLNGKESITHRIALISAEQIVTLPLSKNGAWQYQAVITNREQFKIRAGAGVVTATSTYLELKDVSEVERNAKIGFIFLPRSEDGEPQNKLTYFDVQDIFLASNCTVCHDGKSVETSSLKNLDLTRFPWRKDGNIEVSAKEIEEIVAVVRAGSMPPAGFSQVKTEDLLRLEDWVKEGSKKSPKSPLTPSAPRTVTGDVMLQFSVVNSTKVYQPVALHRNANDGSYQADLPLLPKGATLQGKIVANDATILKELSKCDLIIDDANRVTIAEKQ